MDPPSPWPRHDDRTPIRGSRVAHPEALVDERGRARRRRALAVRQPAIGGRHAPGRGRSVPTSSPVAAVSAAAQTPLPNGTVARTTHVRSYQLPRV